LIVIDFLQSAVVCFQQDSASICLNLRSFDPLHESPDGRGIEDVKLIAKAMMERAFQCGILQVSQFKGTASNRKKSGIGAVNIAQMEWQLGGYSTIYERRLFRTPN
jgi:hypothetical protein